MLFLCFYRLTILFLLIIAISQASELYCVEHKLDARHIDVGTCEFLNEQYIAAAALTNNANNTNNASKSSTTTATTTNENNVTFSLTCKASDAECEGVSATFKAATDIISSVFQLECPLTINATYVNFCQEYQDCNYDNTISASIGQAYPSISYVMVDSTDNVTRMYPQSLLKQFTNLTAKPNWAVFDINAQFNSEINWYFVNDHGSIKDSQTDFLRNVLHELIHGLGFVSAWSDDFYQSLLPLFPQNSLNRFITPILLASTSNYENLNNYGEQQPFWGFVEFAFDKFMSYKNGTTALQPFTSVTKHLDLFGNSNAVFTNMVAMANAWYASDAYVRAENLYSKVVTSLDVLAAINNEPILLLESSLSPFSTGSSLCHVDLVTYINTTEYLMVYTANRGVGITALDQRFPQGPIGPKLLEIMAGLGYRIKNHSDINTIRPYLSYWNPAPGLAGSSSTPVSSLTSNLNGPARIPTATGSSSISAISASSTSKTTSNGSSRAKCKWPFILMSCFYHVITLLY